MKKYKHTLSRSVCSAAAIATLSLLNTQAAQVQWNMQTHFGTLTEWNARERTKDAIDAAKQHLANNPNDVVILNYPAGTFNFVKGNSQFAINVSNIAPTGNGKLRFKGKGKSSTTFVINDNYNQAGIRGNSVKNVEFVNLKLTVDHITSCQGTVVSVAKGEVILDIHNGFATPPDMEREPTNEAGKYLRRYTNSNTNPKIIENNNDQIPWDSSEHISGRRYKINLQNSQFKPNYSAGQYIGIKGKHGQEPYYCVNATNFLIKSIRLERKTRGKFRGDVVDGVKVINVDVQRETFGGKIACLSSDGGGGPQIGHHDSYDTEARNIVVEDNRIVGTGDDCIGLFDVVNGTIDNNYVRDSFARGILLNNSSGSGVTFTNNTAIRAPIVEVSN